MNKKSLKATKKVFDLAKATSTEQKKVVTFPENASPWIYGGSTLAKLLRFMMSRLKEKIQLPKNHLRRKREEPVDEKW